MFHNATMFQGPCSMSRMNVHTVLTQLELLKSVHQSWFWNFRLLYCSMFHNDTMFHGPCSMFHVHGQTYVFSRMEIHTVLMQLELLKSVHHSWFWELRINSMFHVPCSIMSLCSMFHVLLWTIRWFWVTTCTSLRQKKTKNWQ